MLSCNARKLNATRTIPGKSGETGAFCGDQLSRSNRKNGKAVGKDADMGKQTLVTLLGVEGARAEAEKRARRAVEALGPYAAKAPELSALPFFLLDRDS